MSKIRDWIDKYDWDGVRNIYENIIAPVVFVGCILYLMYRIWTSM